MTVQFADVRDMIRTEVGSSWDDATIDAQAQIVTEEANAQGVTRVLEVRCSGDGHTMYMGVADHAEDPWRFN